MPGLGKPEPNTPACRFGVPPSPGGRRALLSLPRRDARTPLKIPVPGKAPGRKKRRLKKFQWAAWSWLAPPIGRRSVLIARVGRLALMPSAGPGGSLDSQRPPVRCPRGREQCPGEINAGPRPRATARNSNRRRPIDESGAPRTNGRDGVSLLVGNGSEAQRTPGAAPRPTEAAIIPQ